MEKCLYLLFTLLLAAGASQAQRSGPMTANSPPWISRGIVTPYAKAVAVDSPLRFARNSTFDRRFGEDPITEDARATHTLTYEPLSRRDPFQMATVALIGKVEGGQAYLSNDKTSLYTELILRVSSVLNNTSGHAVVAGSKITVARAGGVIRMPTGEMLMRGCRQQSIPAPGREYAMLLLYVDQTDEFLGLAAFELRASEVFTLDSLPDKDGYLQSSPMSVQALIQKFESMKF